MLRSKRISQLLSMISFFLIIQPLMPVYAKQPINIHSYKDQLKSYHDSGQYFKDISATAAAANTYLLQQIKKNKKLKQPSPLAIVFDIDETLLSNYNFLVSSNFCLTDQDWEKEIERSNDPAIDPVLKLYHVAISHQVTVFFITGRPEKFRSSTSQNLHHAGYTHWAHLYMKPNHYNQQSAVPFKSGVRGKIEEEGYQIVMNIGDQTSDLEGGYAMKEFKLPNPFYYVR